MDLIAVDNFDFTRKIVKKNYENVVFEFLDKNLTFRIVCEPKEEDNRVV